VFDNINLIPTIEAKVLIIHGDRDSVVPYWNGWELYCKAKNNYKFITVRGADTMTFMIS